MIATLCVHIFACIYFRVKIASADTPQDVTSFYVSRGIDANVGFKFKKCIICMTFQLIF